MEGVVVNLPRHTEDPQSREGKYSLIPPVV